MNGEYYHQGTVVLDHCTMPDGNSTPWQSVDVYEVHFSMHVVSCYSPGGIGLVGNASVSSGVNWSFSLDDRQTPDATGWKTSVSGDSDLAVQWKGDVVRALVHV